jgi:hypothetical protein
MIVPSLRWLAIHLLPPALAITLSMIQVAPCDAQHESGVLQVTVCPARTFEIGFAMVKLPPPKSVDYVGVTYVAEQSPLCGQLKEHDAICALNGIKTPTPEAFLAEANKLRPGDEVKLEVLRLDRSGKEGPRWVPAAIELMWPMQKGGRPFDRNQSGQSRPNVSMPKTQSQAQAGSNALGPGGGKETRRLRPIGHETMPAGSPAKRDEMSQPGEQRFADDVTPPPATASTPPLPRQTEQPASVAVREAEFPKPQRSGSMGVPTNEANAAASEDSSWVRPTVRTILQDSQLCHKVRRLKLGMTVAEVQELLGFDEDYRVLSESTGALSMLAWETSELGIVVHFSDQTPVVVFVADGGSGYTIGKSPVVPAAATPPGVQTK